MIIVYRSVDYIGLFCGVLFMFDVVGLLDLIVNVFILVCFICFVLKRCDSVEYLFLYWVVLLFCFLFKFNGLGILIGVWLVECVYCFVDILCVRMFFVYLIFN